jgi:hypothetical protein
MLAWYGIWKFITTNMNYHNCTIFSKASTQYTSFQPLLQTSILVLWFHLSKWPCHHWCYPVALRNLNQNTHFSRPLCNFFDITKFIIQKHLSLPIIRTLYVTAWYFKKILYDYVRMYVFVGAGFPMHCDLIWSIVRPLWIFKQPPCLHTGPAR